MGREKREPGTDRRGFLKSLGAGTGLAAAAAVSVTPVAAQAENDADKKKARYKETDHVKKFYATNRY